MRERLAQALESYGLSGNEQGQSAMAGDVHLEQLPAYEERSSTRVVRGLESGGDELVGNASAHDTMQATAQAASNARHGAGVPAEPPPGYEEAQRDGLAESLEREQRRQSS